MAKPGFMNKSNEHSIREVINDLLDTFRIRGQYNAARLRNEWDEVVGRTIARHTEDLYLRDGKLIVHIDSAPLKQELFHNREKIRDLINDHFHEVVVEEVVIR